MCKQTGGGFFSASCISINERSQRKTWGPGNGLTLRARVHERIKKLSRLLTARLHWNEAAHWQDTSAHLLNIKYGNVEVYWLGKLFMDSNRVAWDKSVARGRERSCADQLVFTLYPGRISQISSGVWGDVSSCALRPVDLRAAYRMWFSSAFNLFC